LKRVGAVSVDRYVAELDDLRLAVGFEHEGRVGAVDQRLLGHALQAIAARGHEDDEAVLLIGGEGRARGSKRIGGGAPGGFAERPSHLRPGRAVGAAIEGSARPARAAEARHQVIDARARTARIIDIAQKRQIGQDKPGGGVRAHELDGFAGTAIGDDRRHIGGGGLGDALHRE
jgi:hypothetical protein